MDTVPALPESPSTTVVKLDSGCHDFKIIGYSSSRGIGAGKYISIFIESVDTACDVKALFDIRLLHSVSGALSPTSDTWGFYQFMRKKDLEASDYARDDCFTIRCHVVVIKELSDIIGSLANASVNQPD